MAVKISG
ncbi:hypothetical protein ECMA6_2017, partial [Escherichia coli MA6]